MERKGGKKRPKQSKEEIGAKACIREHKRLMKMNECYDKLRTQLNLNPSTSKANTLVETTQYIKMLTHVLKAPQEKENGDDKANGGQVAEPQMDSRETAQELDDHYTLKEDFQAILPADKQDMSITELAKETPYFMKMLSLTEQQTTVTSDAGPSTVPENCATSELAKETPYFMKMLSLTRQQTTVTSNAESSTVPENCATTSRELLPLEVDEYAAVKEQVTEQTPIDQTDETDAEQKPSFTTNSFKFLIKNLLSLPSDDPDVSTPENDPDCSLAMIDEGKETSSALLSSTQTGDPSVAVLEPEQAQLDPDHSLSAGLEANLGEASFEWLETNLTECDEFFNDLNEIIEFDVEDLEELSADH